MVISLRTVKIQAVCKFLISSGTEGFWSKIFKVPVEPTNDENQMSSEFVLKILKSFFFNLSIVKFLKPHFLLIHLFKNKLRFTHEILMDIMNITVFLQV